MTTVALGERQVGVPKATAYCVTVTCFDEQGGLDLAANADLFERLAAAGVGSFVGSASPGEGHSLTAGETEQLYALAKQAAQGRAPARAMGCEMRSAEAYIELVRIAERVGMDAMQIYSLDLGHANHPLPSEQERYFRTVLEAMSIPAIISSHVANGWVPSPELLGRLLDDYPHLRGFNVTNPDHGYVARVVAAADGRCEINVGGPMQAVTILAMGGTGFLCTEANLLPELAAAVADSHNRGDLTARDAAYARLMQFFTLNRFGSSVRYTKAALRVLGRGSGSLRPPYQPLDDATHEQIAAALRPWIDF